MADKLKANCEAENTTSTLNVKCACVEGQYLSWRSLHDITQQRHNKHTRTTKLDVSPLRCWPIASPFLELNATFSSAADH